MTIRLFDLTGAPLDPHAAETHDGEFWAWRVGSYHLARVVPADVDETGRPSTWTVLDRRGPTGVVYREGRTFLPASPQGTPGTSQASLVDALGTHLPT